MPYVMILKAALLYETSLKQYALIYETHEFLSTSAFTRALDTYISAYTPMWGERVDVAIPNIR